MLAAALFGLVFVVHKVAQLVHLVMESLQDGMGGKELLKAHALPFIEPLRSLAQHSEIASMVLEVSYQEAGQLHEVVLDETHDMEAVSHNPGIGEIAADETAIGAGKINADDLHLLPALELA